MDEWECRFCTSLNALEKPHCWKCGKSSQEAPMEQPEPVIQAEQKPSPAKATATFSMKKRYAYVLHGAVTIGIFWLLGPAYLKDRIVGLVTFMSDERQCFNVHKESFKDPETVYVTGSHVDEDRLIVDVRAKNGMGAYVPDSVHCTLVEGRFDASATYSMLLREIIDKRRASQ